MRGNGVRGAIEFIGDDREQRVIDQGRLAGPRHTGDAGQKAGMQVQIDIFQIVAGSAFQGELHAWIRLGAPFRQLDFLLAGQIIAGQRIFRLKDILQDALGDDATAVDAGTGTDVDDMIGGANGVFIVLDHDHGIADVAQASQGTEQALVVALVQADGGFIQNVHDADQSGADLRSKPDALGLAPRKGIGFALQTQVIQADVHQEAQAFEDLLHDFLGDFATPSSHFQIGEEGGAGINRHPADVSQVFAADQYVTGRAVQARALAFRTFTAGNEFAEFLADGLGFGFLVAPFEVGNDALKHMLAHGPPAGLGQVSESDLLVATAEQHSVPHRLAQVLPRAFGIKAVMLGQRVDQLEIISVTPVPAADGAGSQAQFRVQHHFARIEELRDAESVTGRAGPHRRVE